MHLSNSRCLNNDCSIRSETVLSVGSIGMAVEPQSLYRYAGGFTLIGSVACLALRHPVSDIDNIGSERSIKKLFILCTFLRFKLSQSCLVNRQLFI